MSSLQVGLAVAGGLILGGVIAYNTWNARRHEPRQAQPDTQPQPLPEQRVEPVIDGAMAEPERREPVLDPDMDNRPPPDFATTSTLAMLPLPDRRPRMDALIDVIAPIALDGRVVSGDALLAALPATRRVGSKPFAVEGQNERSGEWEHPVAGQRYTTCQAGVQLANRTGALNEIEYSEFVMKAQHYADAVGGAPDFPEMLEEVARARELDQFAGQHDAQLGFTLRARGTAWSPGFVQQQAAKLGFVAGAIPGRMVLPSSEPGLPPILDLSFDAQAALSDDLAHSALKEITLNLDVPQVHRHERPFARLRDAAFTLAEAMGGVITDDAGQPLRSETIDTIGADLERLYGTLEAHDLAAGSPQARRLFS
ncbi:cell division protein ZipA C-terminal FtsZ-binding domain-containing protein [Ottowia testudinis]|uniref:Cell division protein ZipA n=1 Tax=Ottowia testudinis TaxID=2816950 RepID=A0A975CL08_9BURK|nr:cell division protein ZipA C-terminal FtsZ-binding domain-containing protein [Ottowia testudinis]QTD47021.1 cell division protein FtsZ [Ottowia testudinis]